MLRISDLHVSYATAEAVRGVHLSATPGRVTLVLGANGAGKTSTLRAAAGLVRLRAGRVELDGVDITGRAPHRVVRAGMVLVPEGRRVFAPLTVEENLVLGGYTASRERSREVLEQVYGMFPILRERRTGPAGLLSGGEQQMLALARALLARPRLLLLDEPSLGLAPMVVAEIFRIVSELNEKDGLTVLVVEQNARIALEVARRAYVLEVGRVALEGPSAELARNESVRRSYLGY